MVAPESSAGIGLEPRSKVSGTVVKTTLAGAVLDIGHALPGVIHISQLRKEPVNKVEDVLREGQSVTAWVRRVRGDRIELTMIEPLGFTWNDLKSDMIIKGTVTRVETYGAFVEFGAERPGLVHVSEMAHRYVKSAAELVKQGDQVEAKVLDVDRKKRQIRLSMKALMPEPEPEKAREEQDGRGRKHKIAKEAEAPEPEPTTPPEPELTVMQAAWQEALGKSREAQRRRREKPAKSVSKEQEEILQRTLENRITTGN